MSFKIKAKLFIITLVTFMLLFVVDYVLVDYLLDFISTNSLVHFYVLLVMVIIINPIITRHIVHMFKYEEDIYVTDLGKENYMKRAVTIKTYNQNSDK